MRPNQDSAPPVAQPVPGRDPRKVRRADADSARSSRPETVEPRSSAPADSSYDDSSWM